MKKLSFPSIANIKDGYFNVVRRFTVEALLCILFCSTSIIYVELYNKYDYAERETMQNTFELLSKIMFWAYLSFIGTLSVSLWGETKKDKPIIVWLVRAFLLIFTGLFVYFGFNFKDNSDTNVQFFIRYALLSGVFHLLVAYIAYTAEGKIRPFWEFNQRLFIRFLTAIVYSGVLFAGLAGAILAVDQLFNLDIDETIYLKLYIFIASVFHTAFFMAGIPTNQEAEESTYPSGLKTFVQYILVPLVSIYCLILLAYTSKIAINYFTINAVPNGWVANLVLAYSVVGMLCLLLVYPVRNDEGNRWIRQFTKWFFALLIPLILLLVWSIGIRVADYGITESRYAVIMLSAWLVFIVGYYFVKGDTNIIRIIPISLSIVLIISIYGPQSVFSVSISSQMNRFKKMVAENKAADANGFITEQAIDAMPDSVAKEMRSVLYYLGEKNELNRIQKYTKVNIAAVLDSKDFSNYDLIDSLGFKDEFMIEVEAAATMAYNNPDITISIDADSSINILPYQSIKPIDIETYNDEKLESLNARIRKDSVFEINIKGIIYSYNMNKLVEKFVSKNKSFKQGEETDFEVTPTQMLIPLNKEYDFLFESITTYRTKNRKIWINDINNANGFLMKKK